MEVPMKIRNKLIALILCMVMLTLSLCSCSLWDLVPDFLLPDNSNSYHELQNTVTVSIEDGEYYTVTSQNPVKVNKGGTATFDIEIKDGYKFSSSTDGMYENGVLTIPNVKYPTTVSVILKRESLVIDGDTEEDEGNIVDGETPVIVPDYVLNDPENNEENENEDIEDTEEEIEPERYTETIQLTPPEAEEGYHFICWTYDLPAEEGGELLSKETSGTFEISIGRPFYANFVDNEHYVILYRTNGGTTADGKEFYYQTFSSKNYYMPNTIHQNGTFVRDGHVLMRYTENADGTGDYTTLGGKIEVDENGFIELWLKWGKATTSGIKYEIHTIEEVAIDDTKTQIDVACVVGYTGSAINVVIPEKVSFTNENGEKEEYPVRKIAEYAFNNSNLYTITLPNTIHTIEDYAFYQCENLHTLTVHDTLWQVTDLAFSECPKLSTYYLNSGRNPVFAGSTEGLFCMKYEKIRQAHTLGKKKIMVMSGSSSLYGFSAEQMENAFYGEYWVINYGTNAGALGTLYLDAFVRFFDEGDIVIHAPEMNNANYHGGGEITYLTYRGTEEMYEVYSFVDMRLYKGFFDGMRVFNQEKRNKSVGVSYEKYGGSINKMTDLTTNQDAPNFDTTPSSNPYNKNSVNATIIQNINAINKKYNERGTTMYYSFAPIDKGYLNDNALKKENQDAYVARLAEVLDYEIISHPSNYYYDHQYFYNSTYHPGITGRTMRTTALIADLKAQLIKEGKWEEPTVNE